MRNTLEWDNARPRSTQRHIGPSEVGHCREYVRAKVAGDEERELPVVKWAAFIGTALGDTLETVMKTRGAMTQHPVAYRLPRLGFLVHGHLDVLWPQRDGTESWLADQPTNEVWDWKTKDGLESVSREGPEMKEWVQISVYTLAALDAGFIDEDGIGTLVYLDRSGANKGVWTASVTVREARGWIEVAEERLDAVAKALADPAYGDAERHLRDVPESKCWYFGCPFYWQCWPEDYAPSGDITDKKLVAAMEQYDRGREMEKAGKRLMGEAKSALGAGEETPVSGQSEDFRLDWKLRESRGLTIRQIDLRRKR